MRNFSLACLVLAVSVSAGRADTVTVNAFNNGTPATVSYNDGAGHSRTIDTLLTQFNVTYTNGSGSLTFNTFCIDLFHDVSSGQTYLVNPRDDVATAFDNGGRMAYIFENYGTQDLNGNPIEAAAVQLALWDLSLNNHDPIKFVSDGDGTYSSGDPGVFDVSLGDNPNAAAIVSLTNQYLASGGTAQGNWLDAAAQGDYLDRGQSLLNPVPEPSSALLSVLALGLVGVGGWWRRARTLATVA
jgi:hypothetical protein